MATRSSRRGNSPADVFYTENTPALEALREHGLLAPVEPATLAAVSQPLRLGRRGLGWGSPRESSTLVYNTSKLSYSQLPSSILELAQPKWKGAVGFAPSETDFQPLVTAILRLDGSAAAERWLKGLQANGKIYPDNETVVTQVNNGESALGPINHYYGTGCERSGQRRTCTRRLHYFSPGDPGRPGRRLGRGGAEVEHPPEPPRRPSWRSS